MPKQLSIETRFRSALREIADLRKKLSIETQNVAHYRQRASKAEAEAGEWKRRFDQLLARDMQQVGKSEKQT